MGGEAVGGVANTAGNTGKPLSNLLLNFNLSSFAHDCHVSMSATLCPAFPQTRSHISEYLTAMTQNFDQHFLYISYQLRHALF